MYSTGSGANSIYMIVPIYELAARTLFLLLRPGEGRKNIASLPAAKQEIGEGGENKLINQ